MPNKPAYTIADQIQLLKSRGMLFRDEPKAAELLRSKKRRASRLAFFDFLPPNGRMNSMQTYEIT